jgi:hypothetical protein
MAPVGVSPERAARTLPEIPVLNVGADWPFEVLDRELDRVHALLTESSGRIPKLAIRLADAISRRWLERWHETYLDEIDRISARVARPGAYFLNVSYEWGCTTAAGPSPDLRSARLMRTLDWPDRGLGRYLVAVRVESAAGPWLTLTWPGYIGVLQAVAPGRFAAALNQAPMERTTGLYLTDWLFNRFGVWRRPHLTPALLLRQVAEKARDFQEAKSMLSSTPVALPTIYTLAGIQPDEACVIERLPESAHIIDGPAGAANAWQTPGWVGRTRGKDNAKRLDQMRSAIRSLDGEFDWLRPPIFNHRTRLALVADASSGSLVARGYEDKRAATAVLVMTI